MENLGGSAASKTSALVATDVLVVLIAIAAVVVVLGIGVALGIKSRRAQRRHHRHHKSSSPSRTTEAIGSKPAEIPGAVPVEEEGGRRRSRRRRRDHRPRNPSLAEAGGLPPERPEETGSDASPPSSSAPRA